jgi:protein TonB
MDTTPPSAGEPLDDDLRTSRERLGGIFTEVAEKLDVIQAENRGLVDRVGQLDRTVRRLRRELAAVKGELEEARRPAHSLPLGAWLEDVARAAVTRLDEDGSLDPPARSQLEALRAIAQVGRSGPGEAGSEAEQVRRGAVPEGARRDTGDGAEPAEERRAHGDRTEPRRGIGGGNGRVIGDPRPPLPEWTPPPRGGPLEPEERGENAAGEAPGPAIRGDGGEEERGPSRREGSPPSASDAAVPAAGTDPAAGTAASRQRTGAHPASPGSIPASRPRRPLYEPTVWDERFGWFDDAVAKLDPEPLVRRLSPATTWLSRWVGRMALPAAEFQERLARRIGAGYRRVQQGVGASVRTLPVPAVVREALWLDPPRAADSDPEGAHGVLKRRYSAVLWSAVILSVGLHTILFAFWPDVRADDITVASEEIRTVEMPPEVEVPPPPQQIARPAVPVVGAEAVAEDITIAPTTFEENPVEDLPPPPEPGSGGTGPGEPSFTPYTVAPSIQNRGELVRLIRDSYPPALRDAGIGGEVVVWFYIDETGGVQDTRVSRSSGYEALDAAALRVADRFRFTPALNRDNAVAVWVQFPITFVSR